MVKSKRDEKTNSLYITEELSDTESQTLDLILLEFLCNKLYSLICNAQTGAHCPIDRKNQINGMENDLEDVTKIVVDSKFLT